MKKVLLILGVIILGFGIWVAREKYEERHCRWAEPDVAPGYKGDRVRNIFTGQEKYSLKPCLASWWKTVQ